MFEKIRRLKDWLLLGVALIVLVVGWRAINSFFESLPLPSQDAVVLSVAKPVTKKPSVIKKEKKQPSPKPVTLQTYRPETKAMLKLPPEVVTAPAEAVVEAVVIPSTERPQSVVTVVDTETGESTSYVKPEPFPLLKLESKGSLSLDYGYRYSDPTGVDPVGRLNFRYDALQVKGLHLGLSASAYTDGELFGGIGINYRW